MFLRGMINSILGHCLDFYPISSTFYHCNLRKIILTTVSRFSHGDDYCFEY